MFSLIFALLLFLSVPVFATESTFQLPADDKFSPAFQQRLTHVLKAKQDKDTLRTRHRRAYGSPQYTNRLFLESSLYLLQHAHNPVN